MPAWKTLAWETVFWIVWVSSFCVVELLSVCSRKYSYTLTGHVWWMTSHWSWTRAVVLLFLLWLVFHFLIEPAVRK